MIYKEIELFIDGIEIGWLDNTILQIQIRTVNREALKELERVMLAVAQQWPANDKFLILADFSSGKFSPAMRKIATSLAQILDKHHITGRRAVLLPEGVIGNLIGNWMHLVQRSGQALKTRTFADTESAKAWLLLEESTATN